MEGILRHTGYLNAFYFRLTVDERYRQFRAGEHALYLTRPSKRIQEHEIEEIKREYEEKITAVEKRLADVEERQKRESALREWTSSDRKK